MKLLLDRIYKGTEYTIGKLYIGGVYFCDTIEDTVREDGVKVFGKTAIPAGTYQIMLTYSNRFKKVMPQLLNVPNFEGVRIHSGNTELDTEGCLIIGENKEKGKVLNSRVTYDKLMAIFNGRLAGESIEITIQ